MKPEENKEVSQPGETSENKEELEVSKMTVWGEIKILLNEKIYSYLDLTRIIIAAEAIRTLIEFLFEG